MLNVDLDKAIGLYYTDIILIIYSGINTNGTILYIFGCIKNINKLNHIYYEL
jgi:hypothetical protein